MLSAFFLLLAVMLAGGYGPLTEQVAPAPALQSSPTDLGAGGHRSVPFVSKQQILASEARDLKAASWDDGNSKAFLPAKSLELAAAPAGANSAPQSTASITSVAASPYEARAPPAIS